MRIGDGPTLAVVVPSRDPAQFLRGTGVVLDAWRDRCQLVVVADGPPELLPSPLPEGWTGVATGRRRGSGAARNVGASATEADVLLFLDDDMNPDPGALDAHLRFHARPGPHVGLAGGTTETCFGGSYFDAVIEEWLDDWLRSLARCCHYFDALCSANFSVDRRLFTEAGGFDERFVEWGRCDTELGHRLLQAGGTFGLVDGAAAVEGYDKAPSDLLRNFAQMGAADVELAALWPELRDELLLGWLPHGSPRLAAWRTALDEDPTWVDAAVAHLDGAAAAGRTDGRLVALFWLLADHAYRSGANQDPAAHPTLVLDVSGPVLAGRGGQVSRSVEVLREAATVPAAVVEVVTTLTVSRASDLARAAKWRDPGGRSIVFVNLDLLDEDHLALGSLVNGPHEVGLACDPAVAPHGTPTAEVTALVVRHADRLRGAGGAPPPVAFSRRQVPGTSRAALRRAGIRRGFVPGTAPTDLTRSSLHHPKVVLVRPQVASLDDVVPHSAPLQLPDPVHADPPHTRPFPRAAGSQPAADDLGWVRSCFAGPTLAGCLADG